MRVAALLVSALALAACGKAPASGAVHAPSTGAANPGGVVGNLFPNLFQASYRAEATITPRTGQAMPVVVIRSGQNVRMEMDTRGGHVTVIQNPEAHHAYTIMNMAGRQVAMEADTSGEQNPLSQDPIQAWANRQGYTIVRGGPCAGAGQTGTEWTSTRAATAERPAVSNTACVTGDGIILQVKEGERVTWQTTSVTRGPQDAALFSLPPGVRVMNLGNAGALIAGMRNANKPASP